MLDTIAACGDVNRNVIARVESVAEPVACRRWPDWRRRSATHLLPKSRAWHEIWIDGEQIAGGEEEDEPIYGRTYMPRKFKIAVALPPHNDVDVFAHDLGFIAIEEGGQIIGYNVVVGGGMGMTHGEPDTFPRTGDVIGFCSPEQAVDVAEKVVTVQRDFGDRSDRKHARLKYTIERMGLRCVSRRAEQRLGYALMPARHVRVHRQRRPARLGAGRRRRVALHAVRREWSRARSVAPVCMPSPNWASAASSSRRTRILCWPTFRRTAKTQVAALLEQHGLDGRSAVCGATRWPVSRCRPAAWHWRKANATCRT